MKPADVQPGALVVIEVARASFVEGDVVSVGKATASIRLHPGGELRDVDRESMYVVDATKVGVGAEDLPSLGICLMEPRVWVGCRIAGSQGSTVDVEDERGQQRTISTDGVLRPSAITTLNLQQTFAKASSRAAFLAEAARAGLPQRPATWKPRPREPVVVRVGGVYVSGTVREPRRDLALVVVQGEGGTPRAMALDDIFPQPADGRGLAVDDFACLRPSAAERVWQFVRVVRIDRQKVQVKDAQGEVREVAPRDVLPLRKRAAN